MVETNKQFKPVKEIDMDEFFVEKKADESGAHMVHTAVCPSLPEKDALHIIGVRSGTEVPLKEAANWFSKSTPCPNCIAS